MGLKDLWQRMTVKFTAKEVLLEQVEAELRQGNVQLAPLLREQLSHLTPMELGELVVNIGEDLTPMCCHWLKQQAEELGAAEEWIRLLAVEKNPTKKGIAIEALGILRINQASWPLVEVLKKGDQGLQFLAVKAIQRLNTRPLIPALIQGLKDGDFWLPARLAPIIMTWPELALPQLYQILEEEGLEDKVYLIAIDMLGEGSNQEIGDYLLKIFPKHNLKVQLKIVEMVSELGGKEGEDLAQELLTSPHWQLRLQGANFLANGQRENWRELLAPLAEDENPKVAQTVNWLLK